MLFAHSLNNFSLNLFQIMTSQKNENFFISPISILTALTMCLIGAKNETAVQMKNVLGFDHSSYEQIINLNENFLMHLKDLNKNVTINIANKIFPRQGFQILNDYANIIKSNFESDIEYLNFDDSLASATTINGWVSNKTNGKIKDLVSSDNIDSFTNLLLANAIYFEGEWKFKFDSTFTEEKDFFGVNGSLSRVNMMKLEKNLNFLPSPNGIDANVCELSYKGDKVAMTIILPHENQPIQKIEKQINSTVLTTILGSKNLEKINLEIPKFKLHYNSELKSHLIKMGLIHPFSERYADFSGMVSNSKGFHISSLKHEAFVDINEKGTEAAGATAILMKSKVLEPYVKPINFICNRPFLFLIHEKDQNGVLFYGKYSVPE